MGMFDTFLIPEDTIFTCSEGHVLRNLQTKDLACDMDIYVVRDRRVVNEGRQPLLARLRAYDFCKECLVFFDGVNIHEVWVEFEVEFVYDQIRAIARVSAPTTEWLEATRKKENYVGPMSYA